jgi:hypothetical protein
MSNDEADIQKSFLHFITTHVFNSVTVNAFKWYDAVHHKQVLGETNLLKYVISDICIMQTFSSLSLNIKYLV